MNISDLPQRSLLHGLRHIIVRLIVLRNAVLSEYQNELNMQGWKEVMDYDEDDAGFDQSMQ